MTKVWVVDDEEPIRKVLGTMLKDLGYEVELFENPADALSSYTVPVPDVIIADLRMPGMNGIELTRAIMEKDPNALIIILTGFPSIADAVEAIQVGAADFLSKPCRIEEIRLRIDRALENRRLKARLKKTKFGLIALLESLPLWVLLGMILAKFLKAH